MTRLFSVLGDSISTFEGCNPDGFRVYYEGEILSCAGIRSPEETWWARVIRHFDARLLQNASWSGSMVEGAGYPAAWSPERIRALATETERPDDILVFMGTNDYGWGGAAAQACARSAATPVACDLSLYPPAEAGQADPRALEGFAAAYRTMVEALKTAYPNSAIWCISLLPGRVRGQRRPTFAWNLRGIPFGDYCRVILDVAREYGCHACDIAAAGYDYEAIDGTHPTARGMAQIADLVIAAMESRPSPDLRHFAPDPSGDVSSWHSEVLCPHRACYGCEWARSVTNHWMCVCDNPAR